MMSAIFSSFQIIVCSLFCLMLSRKSMWFPVHLIFFRINLGKNITLLPNSFFDKKNFKKSCINIWLEKGK
jgi:hypothetical protein